MPPITISYDDARSFMENPHDPKFENRPCEELLSLGKHFCDCYGCEKALETKHGRNKLIQLVFAAGQFLNGRRNVGRMR